VLGEAGLAKEVHAAHPSGDAGRGGGVRGRARAHREGPERLAEALRGEDGVVRVAVALADGAVERGGFGRIAEGFARTTGPVGSLEAERAARRAHLVLD